MAASSTLPYMQFCSAFSSINNPGQALHRVIGQLRVLGFDALASDIKALAKVAQALEPEVYSTCYAGRTIGFRRLGDSYIEGTPLQVSFGDVARCWYGNVGRFSFESEPYGGKTGNSFYSATGLRRLEYVATVTHWYWGTREQVVETQYHSPWITNLDACERNLRDQNRTALADKISGLHDDLLALHPMVASVTGVVTPSDALDQPISDNAKARYPNGKEQFRLLDNSIIPA